MWLLPADECLTPRSPGVMAIRPDRLIATVAACGSAAAIVKVSV
jgi:hypothetical protein